MSWVSGLSWLAFFCATNRICLSLPVTSSSAFTDFSRPTNSGTIMCGKTTMSRNGSTGNMVLMYTRLGPFEPAAQPGFEKTRRQLQDYGNPLRLILLPTDRERITVFQDVR